MINHMQSLQRTGIDLQCVLDIGSYHGQFGDMIHTVWPQSKVISIEANAEHQSINPLQITACLSMLPNQWVNYYHLPRGHINTGASYYRENTHWYNNPEITPLKTTTLDLLYAQYKWSYAWHAHGLVKLDTQGSELDILHGSQIFLREQQPRFILCEVSHQPYNLGAPHASQVVAWLFHQGYDWLDTWDEFRSPHNMLLQSDILFARRT